MTLRDEFGIVDADLYGWWNKSCPVSTGSDDILATAYVIPGNKTLVAVASWSGKNESVLLDINWTRLGLNAANATVVAPAIESFNRNTNATSFKLGAPVIVPAYQGWLLVMS